MTGSPVRIGTAMSSCCPTERSYAFLVWTDIGAAATIGRLHTSPRDAGA